MRRHDKKRIINRFSKIGLVFDKKQELDREHMELIALKTFRWHSLEPWTCLYLSPNSRPARALMHNKNSEKENLTPWKLNTTLAYFIRFLIRCCSFSSIRSILLQIIMSANAICLQQIWVCKTCNCISNDQFDKLLSNNKNRHTQKRERPWMRWGSVTDTENIE